MSEEAAAPEGHHELVIIKRHGGGHEDAHHGGVWKIAFADFMTAMMAFFLVMWLISANDKTKATIAKYFNPIELVDSRPQPRGLNDSKKDDPNVERKNDIPPLDGEGKETKPTENGGPAGGAQAPRPIDLSPLDDADQSARHSEMELIRDPYAVIAEIATKKNVDPPKASSPTVKPNPPTGGTGAVGLKTGDAFRDPFAPLQVTGPNLLAGPAEGALPAAATARVTSVSEADRNASGAAPTPPADLNPPPAGPAPAGVPAAGAPAGTLKAGPAPASDAAPDRMGEKTPSAAALKARLSAIAKESATPGEGVGPQIDVRRTDEGLLISLTDSADFSMFASASAKPSARAVALMGKIGGLLKAQKGGVTIRGFTDSRPFRSDLYDNWRLSTERAHIAQYMLTRGGLEDPRIDRIEGYADRHPKTPKNPEGAENRRIEILLRDITP